MVRFLSLTLILFNIFLESTSYAGIYNFSLTYNKFRDLLIKNKFPEDSIDKMFCIAKHESAFNPIAYNLNKNGSFDVGLFQINQLWKKWCGMTDHQLLDLNNNVACAKLVWDKQGYTAWVTYKKNCSR